MKKSSFALFIALALIIAGGIAYSKANAQLVAASMPALYNQNGVVANIGSGPLALGYYYLGGTSQSGADQVYYYGNGTYFDTVTMQYGGNVSDPSGTAGVSFNYGVTVAYGTAVMPALYNQNGTMINSGVTYVPAGYYFLTSGTQVYYYGNGTFYNPSIGQYSGSSVNDASGKAGVSLGYNA
jgi:hypothetical protein